VQKGGIGLMIRYPQLNAMENREASKAVKRSNFDRAIAGSTAGGAKGEGRSCGEIPKGRREGRRLLFRCFL